MASRKKKPQTVAPQKSQLPRRLHARLVGAILTDQIKVCVCADHWAWHGNDEPRWWTNNIDLFRKEFQLRKRENAGEEDDK